jgi:hypothetical protein
MIFDLVLKVHEINIFENLVLCLQLHVIESLLGEKKALESPSYENKEIG